MTNDEPHRLGVIALADTSEVKTIVLELRRLAWAIATLPELDRVEQMLRDHPNCDSATLEETLRRMAKMRAAIEGVGKAARLDE